MWGRYGDSGVTGCANIRPLGRPASRGQIQPKHRCPSLTFGIGQVNAALEVDGFADQVGFGRRRHPSKVQAALVIAGLGGAAE